VLPYWTGLRSQAGWAIETHAWHFRLLSCRAAALPVEQWSLAVRARGLGFAPATVGWVRGEGYSEASAFSSRCVVSCIQTTSHQSQESTTITRTLATQSSGRRGRCGKDIWCTCQLGMKTLRHRPRSRNSGQDSEDEKIRRYYDVHRYSSRHSEETSGY